MWQRSVGWADWVQELGGGVFGIKQWLPNPNPLPRSCAMGLSRPAPANFANGGLSRFPCAAET